LFLKKWEAQYPTKMTTIAIAVTMNAHTVMEMIAIVKAAYGAFAVSLIGKDAVVNMRQASTARKINGIFERCCKDEIRLCVASRCS